MKVRDAELADAIRLARLVAQMGSKFEMTADEMKVRIAAFNTPNHKIIVIEHEGLILGAIGIGCYEQLRIPGKCCHIDTLIIDKDYRNKGVGKILMTAAEKYASERGAISLELITANHRRTSGTHAFYAAWGFKNHDELDYTYFSKSICLKSSPDSKYDQPQSDLKLEAESNKIKSKL